MSHHRHNGSLFSFEWSRDVEVSLRWSRNNIYSVIYEDEMMRSVPIGEVQFVGSVFLFRRKSN